jgi:hypothetical protein
MAPYLAHLQEIDLDPSGAPRHIQIRHDDDCACWEQGPTACDCNPEIESGTRMDAAYAAGQSPTDGLTFYKDGRMLYLTRNALLELARLPEDDAVDCVRRLFDAWVTS